LTVCFNVRGEKRRKFPRFTTPEGERTARRVHSFSARKELPAMRAKERRGGKRSGFIRMKSPPCRRESEKEEESKAQSVMNIRFSRTRKGKKKRDLVKGNQGSLTARESGEDKRASVRE